MKIFLLLLILFLPFKHIYGQQNELKRIDYLLEKSDDYVLIDDLKALEYAKQASIIAEKIESSSKSTESYLYIAKCAQTVGAYSESLLYIEKALKEKAAGKDILLKGKLKEMKAANYGMLGLGDQELKEYFEIIDLLSGSRQDLESQRLLYRIESRIAAYYLDKEEYKYAGKFIDKSIKVYKKISKESNKNFSELSDLYNIKGYICLYSKKSDSAYYYFERSYNQINKENKNKTKYIQYVSFGDYYLELKNHQKAIEFYLKALHDMQVYNIKDLDYSQDIYKNISDSYAALNDTENRRKYVDEYFKTTDELKKLNASGFQAAVNTILNEQSDQKEEIKKQYLMILVSGVIVFCVVLVFVYNTYRNTKRKKRILFIEKNQMQDQLKSIIAEKEFSTKKLNITLEEVIQDAKNNRSSFFEKFQQLYPDFCPRLLLIAPNLTTGELILVTYVYLNFSSKEIADYTFRSYRTVQTIKYTLRKKLGLKTADDLYVWLKKQYI